MTSFQNALAVGKDIKSFCGKCKDSRWHTIVSMFDSKTVAKVQCNSCKAEHKYKDPALSLVKRKKSSSMLTKSTAKTRTIAVGDLWIEEMANSTKKSQPYTIKGKFFVGDVIEHKLFGPGIVQQVIDDQIEVVFKDQIKNLVHNK
jgi:hypothetical protein